MISKFLIICGIIVSLVGASFVHDAFLIRPHKELTLVEFTVAPGSSVRSIAAQLHEADLLAHPLFFKWFVAMTHTSNRLQAGTFLIAPRTPIATLVLLLSNPKSTEVQITIPEGFTKDQIKTKLAAAFPAFDVVEWETHTKDLEGYLFPDTYRFAKDASAKEVVAKMRSTLDRRLIENGMTFDAAGRAQGVAPTNKLHDTLTMASIIEKEVQTPEDMKHVAGILFNRMQIGMALQVDSTLTYVTQKSSAELTTADLKLASPYNSYTHKGLPPGPICNPGMNAILGVLHPMITDDFYFLTTDDGRTIYAKTHDQHVSNKQKYLR